MRPVLVGMTEEGGCLRTRFRASCHWWFVDDSLGCLCVGDDVPARGRGWSLAVIYESRLSVALSALGSLSASKSSLSAKYRTVMSMSVCCLTRVSYLSRTN